MNPGKQLPISISEVFFDKNIFEVLYFTKLCPNCDSLMQNLGDWKENWFEWNKQVTKNVLCIETLTRNSNVTKALISK